MEEFLTNYYTFLTKFVEIIAATTGILVYKKYKNTSSKYFIWLLVGVVIMELIGGYTVYIDRFEFLHPIRDFLIGTRFEENSWVYTIFWKIGATLFFVFYFRSLLNNSMQRRILKLAAALFLIAALFIIGFNFNDFFRGAFISINLSSSLLIVITVIFYLLQLLRSESMMDFYKSLNFYIAAALLLWYLITTPLIFYDIYFSRQDMAYVTLKSAIKLFSNIFMYTTFTTALIWCKPANH